MNSSQDLHKIVRERRAIRRYQDRPVARELVERLLNTAMWAPSAHNRQPWRFAVLTDFEHKESLAWAMGERLYEDRMADGDPEEAAMVQFAIGVDEQGDGLSHPSPPFDA